jgi:hypothetical protein
VTNPRKPENADATAKPVDIPVSEPRPAPSASAEAPAAPRPRVGAQPSRSALPPGDAEIGSAPRSVDDHLSPSPQGLIGDPPLVRNHRRFALSDVTFDGQSVGGATIDVWQNAAGADCWSARVLMTLDEGHSAGALSGRTRDGRIVRGRVSLGGSGAGPRTRGAVLVEWHGVSPLRAVDAAAER